MQERAQLAAVGNVAVQCVRVEEIAMLAVHPYPDENGRTGYIRCLNILDRVQGGWLHRAFLRSRYALRMRAGRDHPLRWDDLRPREGRPRAHARRGAPNAALGSRWYLHASAHCRRKLGCARGEHAKAKQSVQAVT